MAKTKAATTKVAATKVAQKKPKAPAGRSAKVSKATRPAARPAAAKVPAAGKAPVAGKSAVTVKAPTAAKMPAPAAAVPIAVPIAGTAAAQAPSKFRREYKRWKDTLISLRHRLRQEGSHLEEEGLKALEQEVSVDHMADYGSDSSEQETTLQLIESNSLSMRDVDDALKRIEAGTYGLCEDCETLVPAARLEVLPHARFCIGCQSKREGMSA